VNLSTERQRWLRVLALAPFARLARDVSELEPLPAFVHVRGPEVGLAMVQGRAGADGAPFNLGEMTVTRCTLRVTIVDDEVRSGFACIAGRSPRHAELAALCDAMLQSVRWRETVMQRVIAPAERALAERRVLAARRRAATKAEFVTVVRSGEA
jgi:alpha-D-ribose 1-methylphosphonate 5-triphosphate synthase subunit PhnG